MLTLGPISGFPLSQLLVARVNLVSSKTSVPPLILCSVRQGSPTPWPRTCSGPRPVRNRAQQQEVSGGRASEASSAASHRSHYRLNHIPPSPTPRSVERLSSTKPVLGAKKVRDHCHKGLCLDWVSGEDNIKGHARAHILRGF